MVTMKGNPVKLAGQIPNVGDDAPDCTLVANDLSEFKLSSLKGKKVILSVVPSLDTPVCDLQSRRFNSDAAGFGDDARVVTVSMDLPFAQKRWCGQTGSDKLITLSDHRDAAFGKAYGLLVDGLRLLARAVFVVDAEGTIRYKQVVEEISHEPDYEAALEALKKL